MFLAFCVVCCSPKKTVKKEISYWKGADIGWATEMEAKGEKLFNKDGKEMECTALMKELGLNAVRFRVWVDPHSRDGKAWNGKEDLLVKAKRAKDLGMEIMVNFHYSDDWADPKHQNIPAAWSGKSVGEVESLLSLHTKDILSSLKAEGIEPKWVQVGNETSNGFLWSARRVRWEEGEQEPKTPEILESMGHFPDQSENYARFFKAGYKAVKEVFPDAKVIVHLDNGFNQALYDNNLDSLKKYGAKWDIVGMSLYPYWALDSGLETSEEQTIKDGMANIRHIVSKYDTPVMIVETGFTVDEEHPEVMQKGRDYLGWMIRASRDSTGTLSDGVTPACQGIFYWEPECRPRQYKLGAFGSDGKPTVIMEGFAQ